MQHFLRPRLVAVAPSVAEVVQFAGGWLFDQVMAGWDVTVLTADHADSRPLEILGARGADLDSALERPVRASCLRTVALRADLFGQDARIRHMVLETVGDGRAEVRLWGECGPGEAGDSAPVRHQLSTAARAFKAQAMAAAAAPAAPAEVTEVFRRFSAASASAGEAERDPAGGSPAEGRRPDLTWRAPVPVR